MVLRTSKDMSLSKERAGRRLEKRKHRGGVEGRIAVIKNITPTLELHMHGIFQTSHLNIDEGVYQNKFAKAMKL